MYFVVALNDCASDPCLNGGTCEPGPGGYSCACQEGYDGNHCEVKRLGMKNSFICLLAIPFPPHRWMV